MISAPKGLALFLVVVGVVLAFAGALAVMATGERKLFAVFAAGCVLQVVGWYRQGSRFGGAA